MLVISGRRRWRGCGGSNPCFNLAIEMLVISGAQWAAELQAVMAVSISQSRCLSFQVNGLTVYVPRMLVSISQSRCLSFQDKKQQMSNKSERFQSRNRDACHFRLEQRRQLALEFFNMFQSRNRDACHFRSHAPAWQAIPQQKFQSRNRDACHFRKWNSCCNLMSRTVSISQSRCLSFQAPCR